MKVQLNTVTNYESKSLKLGDVIDIPLNVAMRWISKGIAHPVKEEMAKGGVVSKGEFILPIHDQALNKIQIEKLKEFKEKTEEEIILREPEIKVKIDKKVKKVAKGNSK